MKFTECESYLRTIFDAATLNPGEFQTTSPSLKDISILAYATNLSPEVIEIAQSKKAELLLTHHDAWDFMPEMKRECEKLLAKHNISHIFAHLPLDSSDFGPAKAFADRIDAVVKEKCGIYENFYCGRVAEFNSEKSFLDLVMQIQFVCKERVLYWENNKNAVSRVYIMPGAGIMASYIDEAKDKCCNTFITGEKNLYTLAYARFLGINMIVGSHTYTEYFGIEYLANAIKNKFPELSLIGIEETHFEANPMTL